MSKILGAMVWVGVVLGFPAVGVGQQAPDRDVRVAVVALDDGARAGSLMQTVSGLLDRAKFDVIIGGRLERQLRRRRAKSAPREVTSRFAGLSAEIADGVEKFFYKGNRAAIETLSPAFDLGMNHPEVLARRPDYAAQIYQAGLVMIRAYKQVDEEDNARSVARLLVKSLPGLEPSAANVPPKIVRFIEAERERLAEQGTTLEVQQIDGEECTSYINGTPVGDQAYPAAAGVGYLVTMDCGGTAAPVWRLELTEGQQAVAPVSPVDPLEFVMEDAMFRQRTKAEAYMRLVAYWSGVPRVLGVTRVPTDETGNALLFARVQHGEEAVWSDETDDRAISRGLARVLPAYGEMEVATEEAGGAPSDVDWLGWSLVGGGVALAGAGTWVTLAAEDRAQRVQCSPDTDFQAGSSECDGVPVLEFDTQSEIEDAESEVTLARIAGYGSLGVGVGLAAWGVWRLVSVESPRSQPAMTFEGRPLRGGGMASMRWRF